MPLRAFGFPGLCVLLMALIVASILFFPASAQSQPTVWYDKLEQGLAVRNATHKPALVFFSNRVARDCHRMRTETLPTDEVGPMLANFVCFEMDASLHPELLNHYNVFKVPTILFLDPQGKEVDRAIGFKPPQIFRQYLDRTNKASLGDQPATANATRLAEIIPFKTATINVLHPHPGSKAITLSYTRADAAKVSLVGDFNDWRDGSTPMQRAVNGDWFVTIHVPEGTYEYKYLVDSGEYVSDERNPFSKPNKYGTVNSVLVIGNPPRSPSIEDRNVTFVLYRPEASRVELAGSFTQWQPVTMFRKREDPAMWGVRYTLPPGQYAYKFLIDGEWTPDPENLSALPDGTGNVNSSFLIH